MIRVEDLEKIFNKNSKGLDKIHAIRKTSVSFENTGLVCILGGSGSGKTTLLNVISGLECFDKGTLLIGDAKLKKYSSKIFEDLRIDKFGYIFQNYMLLEEYSVEYNIRIALAAFDLPEKEVEERVIYAMEKLGILKSKNKLAAHLSGGQKQRVAIARAIVKSPKVIFADEPTGNLDEANTFAIMNIMKKISEDHLILMVTHDKHIARCYADRIITINDGTIISDINNKDGGSAIRYDDMNLYLQSYQKKVIKESHVQINLYGEPSEDITLNIVWDRGRYYIRQEENDENSIVLNANSEIKMIDAPKVELEKIEEVEFELTPLTAGKKKVPWGTIRELAKSMYQAMNKRQMYLKLIFIVNTLLLVLAVAGFFSVFKADKKSIITSDSHYVAVDIEPDKPIDEKVIQADRKKLVKQIASVTNAKNFVADANFPFLHDGSIFSRLTLILYGQNFSQVKLLSTELTDFSVVPKDYLDNSKMICGKTGSGSYDVVIDKWLADKILASNKLVFQSYQTYEDLIGTSIKASVSEEIKQPFKITGVCDTGEPSIYMDRSLLMFLMKWTDYIKYKDGTLLQYLEILVNKLGQTSNTFNADYNKLIIDCISVTGHFLIYTDDTDLTMKHLNHIKKEFAKDGIRFRFKNIAEEQMKQYEAAHRGLATGITIVTASVLFLTIIVAFFSLQSYAVSQKSTFFIYLTQGIKKKNLYLAYLLELIFLMCSTVLPTLICASLFVKFMTHVQILKLKIIFPWQVVPVLLILIFCFYILLAILPVWNIIRKPLAHLSITE